jgi:outer membrane lipoprotein-sorting protein
MKVGGRVAPAVSSVLACAMLAGSLTSACLAKEGTPTANVDFIVQKMIAANARRAQELQSFTGKRLYRLDYHGFPGSRDAEMQVETVYTAPDKKNFKIVSESGSKLLINHVFLKLLESEKEYLEESTRRASELSPRNYKFSFVAEDHTPEGDFYVLSVDPREKSKFLYKGKIWVDERDFAVARIEAEPAKNPSFWISHTEIKHRYQKIGAFWLPAHNESITQVRLGGKAVLSIDYSDYQVTSTRPAEISHSAEDAPVPPSPASVTADPH